MNACRTWSLPVLVCLFVSFTSCDHNRAAVASGAASGASGAAASATQPAQPPPAQAPLVKPAGQVLRVDPARAWLYVKEILAFGPRWDGSKGQEKLGQYLHAKLKNDQAEDDAFVADTPAGKIPMRNIVAKFPGTKDGIIVLGSHIDTNYPLRKTSFVGANDGASTTALLLAIADQLRGKKLEGYSIWLAFFDGEESIPSNRPGDLSWSDPESLYGSRHLAQKWEKDGTNKKIKAFFLLDMIGDKDLDILRDSNSTPWLLDLVDQAARRLGYQSYFFSYTATVSGDDHLPFKDFGVPVADIIDLDYGYNGAFHHSVEDTIDKISPKSLQVTGDVMLEAIRLLNARP